MTIVHRPKHAVHLFITLYRNTFGQNSTFQCSILIYVISYAFTRSIDIDYFLFLIYITQRWTILTPGHVKKAWRIAYMQERCPIVVVVVIYGSGRITKTDTVFPKHNAIFPRYVYLSTNRNNHGSGFDRFIGTRSAIIHGPWFITYDSFRPGLAKIYFKCIFIDGIVWHAYHTIQISPTHTVRCAVGTYCFGLDTNVKIVRRKGVVFLGVKICLLFKTNSVRDVVNCVQA